MYWVVTLPASTLPVVVVPETVRLPRVPTSVMLVCEELSKVPTRLEADTVPLVVKLPTTVLPVTARLTSVPTLVIAV